MAVDRPGYLAVDRMPPAVTSSIIPAAPSDPALRAFGLSAWRFGAGVVLQAIADLADLDAAIGVLRRGAPALWNTIYLDKASAQREAGGRPIPNEILAGFSPLI